MRHGHELNGDVTPIQTGLDFAVRKNGGFIGAEALAVQRSQGIASHIISLIFDDRNAVPFGHEPIYLDKKIMGQISSAAYGYRVNAPVALGQAHAAHYGVRVRVDIAGAFVDATVIAGPLYAPGGTRMKGDSR